MLDEKIIFDTELKSTDWRSSAAIIGLIRYLDYHQLPYNKDAIFFNQKEKEWDTLRFNKEDVTEERYLEFVEYYYKDELHHIVIKEMLQKQEFKEEDIVAVNKKLVSNSILKKVFGKLKFDGTNKNEIYDCIEQNRIEIVRETFRNKKNLYANFCNTNQLFNEEQTYCRLNGYYIDGPKKGKSISYQFNPATYIAKDSRYFDFIIFAFTIGRESFFINDNSSLEQLMSTNNKLQTYTNREKSSNDGVIDIRKVMFEAMIKSADFIDYDVEVITKNIEHGYFETLMLRKESIRILQSIDKFEYFCFSYKVTDNYYINVQKEVTDHIVNLLLIDGLIEFFLKEENKDKNHSRFSYLISKLIEINIAIRYEVMEKYSDNTETCKEGKHMKQSMKVACACAGQVVKAFEKRNQVNKISSYRTKLTSAIVFKDYDRFCDILIQLAQYSDVQLNFAYDLFEDFEANKDLAYAFVNALAQSRNQN